MAALVPRYAATVAITPPAGITLATTSLTTNSSGQAGFPWVSTLTFGYSISYGSRFTTASGSQTGCFTVTLSPASGYTCACSPCPIPMCNTLDLTDSVIGAVTLTFTGGSTWSGTIDYAFPGYCNCLAATIPVTYYYDGCTLNIEFPTGPGNVDPCNGSDIEGCPIATGTDFAEISPSSTVSFSCAPTLDASYSISGCTQTLCFGVCYGCYGIGAESNGALGRRERDHHHHGLLLMTWEEALEIVVVRTPA